MRHQRVRDRALDVALPGLARAPERAHLNPKLDFHHEMEMSASITLH